MSDQVEGSPIIQASDEWARQVAKSVSKRLLSSLVARLSTHLGIPDYDREARVFAAAYHRINTRKALRALRDMDLSAVRTALDVGCGSGAATAALIALWLTQADPKAQLTVILVDRSPRQLSIAHECMAATLATLDETRVRLTYLEADAAESHALASVPRSDVILAAHVLSENHSTIEAMIRMLDTALAPGGTLVAIDQADDLIWTLLEEQRQVTARDWLPDTALLQYPDPVEVSSRPWTARWVAITRLEVDSIQRLVSLYFRAWRDGDTEALESLFAVDATYQEKPFTVPLEGLPAIEDYWRTHVVPQASRRIAVRRLAAARRAAVAEWDADFVLGGERVCVSGTLVFETDATHDRIVAVREYFRTHRQPTAPLDTR